MNGYFVPEPHEKPAPRAPKRPNSKMYTLKELRQCAGSELPLHLDVSATKKEEGYAVYEITTSSVSTQNRWHASYRYSEFLAFRNQVEEVWTCHDEKCQGSCQSVRDLMEACFPKKAGIMSTWSFTVEDRKAKFKNVLIHLLRSVLLPGSTMKCFHARQHLPPALFEFLGIEDDADKRSLLQVYVDNHQGGMKKSASHTGLSSLEHHQSLGMKKMSSMKKSATTPNLAQMELEAEEKGETATVENPQCMICLEEVEDHVHAEGPQGLVTLPCKHSFHRECVFEWLLFQYHCPMCRAQVGPHAMTNYACPKKQEQWWLGNFKENPLEKETDVSESIPGNPERILNVSGPLDAVSKSFGLIVRRINDEPFDTPSVPGSRAVTIKFIIPHSRMGSVIGRGGTKIKEIQDASGAKLNASEGMLPGSTERILSVSGVADAIHIATYYVGNILIEAAERQPNSNSTSTYRPSGTSSRGPRGSTSYAPAPYQAGYGAPHYGYPPPGPYGAPPPGPTGPPQTQQIYIPNDLVGCIIGKGGSKINEIRSLSASQIRIMEPGAQGPPGTAPGNPNERLVIITGQPQNIQMAVNLLYHRLEQEKQKQLTNAQNNSST